MSRPWRPGLAPIAIGLAGLLLATASAWAVHQWSVSHVGFQMGAEYTDNRLDDLLGETSLASSCVVCHVDVEGGTLRDRLLRPTYVTPVAIEACPGGAPFLVVARDSDALLVVDPATGSITRRVAVGHKPQAVAADHACRTAYVANEDDDTVSVVDLALGVVTTVLPTGYAPAGLGLDPSGRRLYVANRLEDDISVFEVPEGRLLARLPAGHHPARMKVSPDGRRLLVAAELASLQRHPAIPMAEVTEIDLATGAVGRRFQLENAHLLGGIAFTPDARWALVTLVKPTNLVPILRVEMGWVMSNAVAVLDLETGRVVQLSLDRPHILSADPTGIAVTPDASTALVSIAGMDFVAMIDLAAVRRILDETAPDTLALYGSNTAVARGYVVKYVDVGANPGAIVIPAEGQRAYVLEQLDDSLAVLDLVRREVVEHVSLGGPSHVTVVRQGEIQFNQAGEFSCRGCHPRAAVTGLQYDFEPDGLGRAILDVKSLLATRDTVPYKWTGTNRTQYMQCGIRFERFVSRLVGFSFVELTSLVAYVRSLEAGPRRRVRDGISPEEERGRELFERTVRKDGRELPVGNRCTTCHPGSLGTDLQVHDVGTRGEWDTAALYDTPQLSNLADTAPYLHDGRALTLEELWTRHNPRDLHGVTSDLTSDDISDLCRFLKTL